MGYIYKITNTTNGMGYVGKTTQKQMKRFIEHLGQKDHNTFHLELREHPERFVQTTLEICPNENLQLRELYWTLHERTYYPFGYNVDFSSRSFGNAMSQIESWKPSELQDEFIKTSEHAKYVEAVAHENMDRLKRQLSISQAEIKRLQTHPHPDCLQILVAGTPAPEEYYSKHCGVLIGSFMHECYHRGSGDYIKYPDSSIEFVLKKYGWIRDNTVICGQYIATDYYAKKIDDILDINDLLIEIDQLKGSNP